MRAYKAADTNGDSFIGRAEFAKLLWFLTYFNNLWETFSQIDTDQDRRLNVEEFTAGCALLGLKLSAAEAREEFEFCDKDGGGMVLFEEFCVWVAKREYSKTQRPESRRSPTRRLRTSSPSGQKTGTDGQRDTETSGQKNRAGTMKGTQKARPSLPLETTNPQSPSPSSLLSALGTKLGYGEAELEMLVQVRHTHNCCLVRHFYS